MTRSIVRVLPAIPMVVILAGAVGAVGAASSQPQVNPQAAVLKDFDDRVKAYVDLRNKANAQTPPLKETKEPAEIAAAQQALATKIRTTRVGAKQGDIFTPEIAKLLRALLMPEMKGTDGAETRATIKADQPLKVPLTINAPYPDDEPLSTVPPNILQSLPKLPDGMEYRFVRRYMILRDAKANVIVDFMADAIR